MLKILLLVADMAFRAPIGLFIAGTGPGPEVPEVTGEFWGIWAEDTGTTLKFRLVDYSGIYVSPSTPAEAWQNIQYNAIEQTSGFISPYVEMNTGLQDPQDKAFDRINKRFAFSALSPTNPNDVADMWLWNTVANTFTRFNAQTTVPGPYVSNGVIEPLQAIWDGGSYFYFLYTNENWDTNTSRFTLFRATTDFTTISQLGDYSAAYLPSNPRSQSGCWLTSNYFNFIYRHGSTPVILQYPLNGDPPIVTEPAVNVPSDFSGTPRDGFPLGIPDPSDGDKSIAARWQWTNTAIAPTSLLEDGDVAPTDFWPTPSGVSFPDAYFPPGGSASFWFSTISTSPDNGGSVFFVKTDATSPGNPNWFYMVYGYLGTYGASPTLLRRYYAQGFGPSDGISYDPPWSIEAFPGATNAVGNHFCYFGLK